MSDPGTAPVSAHRWVSDKSALLVIVLLTAVIVGHRWVYDDWLGRHDVNTQLLPWFGYLGDQLRIGNIPDRNPSWFGGAPFAADPQTGWMFIPAMLFFPFFEVTVAFKLMILFNLLLAGVTMYAFGRLVGFRMAPALLSALLYELGPLLITQTDCCSSAQQVLPWIPLSFLGVEVAVRARTWRSGAAGVALSGLAASQLIAGWMGQGAVNLILILGAWVAYRTLISPPDERRTMRERLLGALVIGPSLLLIGIGIGAAGLWPRLEANAWSTLPGGSYDGVTNGTPGQPSELWYAVLTLLSNTYRSSSIAGGAFVLAVIAVMVCGRRYAVPFFGILTLVLVIMVLPATVIHRLFYAVVPGFEALHTHSPQRVRWILSFGPPLLAGAGLQILPELRSIVHRRWLLLVPLATLVLVDVLLGARAVWLGWWTFFGAGFVTLVVWLVAYPPDWLTTPWIRERLLPLASVGIIAVTVAAPNGHDIARSINDPDGLTQPNNLWQHQPARQEAIALNLARDDPGGAGEFLLAHELSSGPFRYASYAGRGFDAASSRSYAARRFEPSVMAILVNARPARLGLETITGYNPFMLRAWYDYMTVLNGRPQDYHFTDILSGAGRSQLLDMLNVRYLVVDASIASDREDIVHLTSDRPEVFRNDLVTVYENPGAFPRAWIVHEVRSASPLEALEAIHTRQVDARDVAFLDGPAPVLLHEGPATATRQWQAAPEAVDVNRKSDDALAMTTTSAAAGLLVVSEVYDPNWHVTIDGRETEVYQANGALVGLALPAGDHRVELEYRSESLRKGLYVSSATIVLCLVVLGYAARVWFRERRAVDCLDPVAGGDGNAGK